MRFLVLKKNNNLFDQKEKSQKKLGRAIQKHR